MTDPKTPVRTMEQFARAIGISRPTVSKYFQDPASVRPRVREKIEAGLDATGFRPNLFAVNLNRRRAKIIGLVLPTTLDPFYSGLRQRIEKEVTAAGYLCFVFSADGLGELEAEAIQTLSALNVAGVIMAPVGAGSHHDKIKALAREVPIVFVDTPFDDTEAFVGTDNAQSMALITDYLSRFGHPCYFDMPDVNSNTSGRRNGYIAAMQRLGLDPLLPEVTHSRSWDFERFAFEETRRILASGGFPTDTILCGNDRVAFGMLAAINQAGLRIGIGADCDLRVAGHDNQPLSEYSWPPLTTVAQNTAEMGRRAIGLLLSRLDGSAEHKAPHILVNGELVLRASA